MKGHCACQATGLSSHAIARRFGHCLSGGNHYPHDPSDLLRCVDYCRETGIGTAALRHRMSDVSPEWAALTSDWDALVISLREEQPTGSAPRTYARMKELIGGSR